MCMFIRHFLNFILKNSINIKYQNNIAQIISIYVNMNKDIYLTKIHKIE